MESDDLAYIYRKIFAGYFYPCLKDPYWCMGIPQCRAVPQLCMSTAERDSLPYFASKSELEYFEERVDTRLSEGFRLRWREPSMTILYYMDADIRFTTLKDDYIKGYLADYRLRTYMALYIEYSCHGWRLGSTFYDRFRVYLLTINVECITTHKIPLINERWGLEIFKNQVKTYSEVHYYAYYFSGVPIEFVYLSSNRFSPSHYLKKEVIGNKVKVYCLHNIHKVGWTLITIHITVINYWQKLQLLGFKEIMRKRLRWRIKCHDCFARIGGLPRGGCFVLRLPVDLYWKVVEYF